MILYLVVLLHAQSGMRAPLPGWDNPCWGTCDVTLVLPVLWQALPLSGSHKVQPKTVTCSHARLPARRTATR